MLVTAVGPNSQQGRIFALMRGIQEESGGREGRREGGREGGREQRRVDTVNL